MGFTIDVSIEIVCSHNHANDIRYDTLKILSYILNSLNSHGQ